MKPTDDMMERAMRFEKKHVAPASWTTQRHLEKLLTAALEGYATTFELEPAERIAFTVASSIAERGESLGANTTTVLLIALNRALHTLESMPRTSVKEARDGDV